MKEHFDPNDYAVIRFSGRNYRVSPGSRLIVDSIRPGQTKTSASSEVAENPAERCEGAVCLKPGSEVRIEEVLLAVKGKSSDSETNAADRKVVLGTPYISGALVTARVVSNKKSKKVLIFKKKRRTGYAKYQGHRQAKTELVIEQISL